MKMKKLLTIAAVALCALGVLGGCGGPAENEPTAEQVAHTVWTSLTFDDTINVIDDDVILNYFHIDWSKVADKAVYTSNSKATPEEVAVFKMESANDVQLAKDAFNERLEDKKFEYETYIPEEMPKINNAVILEHGKYVVLAVSADNDGAEQAFEKIFEQSSN